MTEGGWPPTPVPVLYKSELSVVVPPTVVDKPPGADPVAELPPPPTPPNSSNCCNKWARLRILIVDDEDAFEPPRSVGTLFATI